MDNGIGSMDGSVGSSVGDIGIGMGAGATTTTLSINILAY